MSTILLRQLKKPKACFFDLDGTLEDSAYGILKTIEYLCQKLEIIYPGDKKLRPFVGEGIISLLKLCDHTLSEEKLNQGFLWGLEYHRENAFKHTAIFSDVQALLEEIDQQKIIWGIVTNKVRSIIEPSLKRLPFKPQNDLIICADDLRYAKPHPLPLIEICQRAKIKPYEAIFIGDSVTDLKAAKSANVKAIFANYGYGNFNEAERLGFDATINNLEELRQWLIFMK